MVYTSPFQRMLVAGLLLLSVSGCRHKRKRTKSVYAVSATAVPNREESPVTVTGGTRIDTILRGSPAPDLTQQDEKGASSYAFVPQMVSDESPPTTAQQDDTVTITENEQPILRHRDAKNLVISTKPAHSAPMVTIDFKEKTLSSIINHFAAIQGRNIIFPPGADALSQKVTFELPRPIPLHEVDTYLDLLLEIAGYARVQHGSCFKIVPDKGIDRNVNRESLRLFAGATSHDIPATNERIRTVIYLQNLKVPENPQGNDTFTIMIRDMLSPNAELQYDVRSNAIVLADKAQNIKMILTLLKELDTITIKEVIRTLPLYNRGAQEVAKLLTDYILSPSGGDDQQQRSDAGRYFQVGTRVVPDTRANALILMGREPAVERLREFVRNHIDTTPESGNSVLHHYELQYLDAIEFAPILERIVHEAGASGQSTQQQQDGGAVRGFDGVIVSAEKPEKAAIKQQVLASGSSDSSSPGMLEGILEGDVYRGGNRLIIAANKVDWERVVQLIQELDKPQLQVIIQTLILDFDVTDNKTLATQMRNPSWMQLPKGITFQSDMITDTPILNETGSAITAQTTLASDLLRLLTSNPAASAANIITSTTAGIGSTIMSINDPSSITPGIWSFVQWLNQFGSSRVLSNPFLVVVNNRKASEEITVSKRAPDNASVGEGGATTRKIINLKASLKITVVPRASSANRVNLQVSIGINQFFDPRPNAQYNMQTRNLHTNVNLSNGEMVVLGGLSNKSSSDQDFETPLLGRIPILRWLFSRNEHNVRKTNLVVLIAPTVIQPKIRDGMNKFSWDTTGHVRRLLEDGLLLDQLRDPIAQTFFNDPQGSSVTTLDRFLAEGTGDFVYPNTRSSEIPSSHHCRELPQTKYSDPLALPSLLENDSSATLLTPKQEATLAQQKQAQQSKRLDEQVPESYTRVIMLEDLKAKLALESNPIASSHHTP